MKMITFSLKAAKLITQMEESALGIALDKVKPNTSHIVGVTSGSTGVAIWADLANKLQPIAGFLVTIVALFGGCFYAIYWLYRMLRERNAYRDGEPIATKTKSGK